MRPIDPNRRPNAALMLASQTSVSVAGLIELAELREALHDPNAPHQPYVRRMMEEASERLLAGLVLEGFTDWQALAEAADRYPPARDETTAWLWDMARLSVA